MKGNEFKQRKQVKLLIDTNNQVVAFIDYLYSKYDFDHDELEVFENFKKHMENLNIIFSKVKK